MGFVVDGAVHVAVAVPAPGVKPAFDVFEDAEASSARVVQRFRFEQSRCRIEKNDSQPPFVLS